MYQQVDRLACLVIVMPIQKHIVLASCYYDNDLKCVLLILKLVVALSILLPRQQTNNYLSWTMELPTKQETLVIHYCILMVCGSVQAEVTVMAQGYDPLREGGVSTCIVWAVTCTSVPAITTDMNMSLLLQVQEMYFAKPPISPGLDFYKDVIETLVKYNDRWIGGTNHPVAIWSPVLPFEGYSPSFHHHNHPSHTRTHTHTQTYLHSHTHSCTYPQSWGGDIMELYVRDECGAWCRAGCIGKLHLLIAKCVCTRKTYTVGYWY